MLPKPDLFINGDRAGLERCRQFRTEFLSLTEGPLPCDTARSGGHESGGFGDFVEGGGPGGVGAYFLVLVEFDR